MKLEDYKKFLISIDLENDKQFLEAITIGIELFSLSNKDIAHRFNMSLSSVDRWKAGRNLPHPAFRKVVINYLMSFC